MILRKKGAKIVGTIEFTHTWVPKLTKKWLDTVFCGVRKTPAFRVKYNARRKYYVQKDSTLSGSTAHCSR